MNQILATLVAITTFSGPAFATCDSSQRYDMETGRCVVIGTALVTGIYSLNKLVDGATPGFDAAEAYRKQHTQTIIQHSKPQAKFDAEAIARNFESGDRIVITYTLPESQSKEPALSAIDKEMQDLRKNVEERKIKLERQLKLEPAFIDQSVISKLEDSIKKDTAAIGRLMERYDAIKDGTVKVENVTRTMTFEGPQSAELAKKALETSVKEEGGALTSITKLESKHVEKLNTIKFEQEAKFGARNSRIKKAAAVGLLTSTVVLIEEIIDGRIGRKLDELTFGKKDDGSSSYSPSTRPIGR